MKSQLSGKFSKQDNGIFVLREKLIKAGIEIEFPFSDKIIAEYKGVPVTFVSSSERTFYDVEIAFFEAIKRNPIHIVHNKHETDYGYIGESASIEIAYAILQNKPIVLLYNPTFSNKVPPAVKKLIEANARNFFVKRLDLLSRSKLFGYLSDTIKHSSGQYTYSIETEINAMGCIVNLFNEYKS